MAKKSSLREFQENLAHRIAESQESDRRTLLGVEAGNQNWLINLIDTGEVLPVPPLKEVPLTQDWFRGIANVRGVLYGVVDFSSFAKQSRTVIDDKARLLLISERHASNTALLFSRTTGLRNSEEFEMTPHNANDTYPWVAGAYRDVQERQWLHLNLKSLLEDRNFLEAGALGNA